MWIRLTSMSVERAAKVGSDLHVVHPSSSKRLLRQCLSGGQRQTPCVLLHLCDYVGIQLVIDDDRNVLSILCCRPNHRRATDVDLLNHFVFTDVSASHRLLERIEI